MNDIQNGLPKYRNKRTALFSDGKRVKEFQAFKDQAERRLDVLKAAVDRQPDEDAKQSF